VQAIYADRFVPLAIRGLQGMFLVEQAGFCHKVWLDGAGQLQPSGISDRYTAMVLIGLACQGLMGRSLDLPLDSAWDRVISWALGPAGHGDTGLVLWAASIKGDDRAPQIAEAIARRQQQILAERALCPSMETGWLLTGLSEAMSRNIGGQPVAQLAEKVFARLTANFCESTGLFSFGRGGIQRSPLAERVSTRLGSFASQVYPTIGLSRYAVASGSQQALATARRCADALCRLQGPEGQWWWVYHVRKGTVAVRYPVYTVHQDAMGPMALLAVSQAERGDRYAAAVHKSLQWMEAHPECPDKHLVNEDRNVIWRAVQRDRPLGTGNLGLGRGELLRTNLVAWTGTADKRRFDDGFVCDECRPYHLGWILLAGAMAQNINL